MCAQDFLDLFDEDLFAAGVHDQRVTAEQADGAVLFNGCPVAGYHHALALDLRKRSLGGLGIVEVTEWDPTGPYRPADLLLAGPQEPGAVGRYDRRTEPGFKGLTCRSLVAVPERHV